ncbi:MAG: hypothetical protein R3C05_11905 [Pirellulaceae bacterium]
MLTSPPIAIGCLLVACLIFAGDRLPVGTTHAYRLTLTDFS